METKNELLLNDNIDKIESKNGIIYIKDSKLSGPEVILFDHKGKHLRNIDRCGEGPEEYINGVNIAINDKGHVSFADRTDKGRIVTYNSEGKIPVTNQFVGNRLERPYLFKRQYTFTQE